MVHGQKSSIFSGNNENRFFEKKLIFQREEEGEKEKLDLQNSGNYEQKKERRRSLRLTTTMQIAHLVLQHQEAR